jgi:biopolymer transport protein ExbD
MVNAPSQSTGEAETLGMSRLQSILRSRITWAILGMAMAGYFAFLVALLGIFAVAPRNIVVLNLNDEGDLVQSNGAALVSDEEISEYLNDLFEKARRTTTGGQTEQLKTLVVITAPLDLKFKHVWRVMHIGTQGGFHRWDLRSAGEDVLPDSPLPEAEEVIANSAAPPEPDLELPLNIVLRLRAVRDGKDDGSLAAIVIGMPEGETAVPDLDILRRFLREKRGNAARTNQRLHIEADSNLRYGLLLKAVKECEKAGFKRVCYLPPPGWDWPGN